jgi:hypothetical protein
VQAGALQAWKARQVARHTTTLPPEAVDYLDRHLAVTGTRNRIPATLDHVIHTALLRTDPDTARTREHAALAARDVTFDHRPATATTLMVATLDTPDALHLDATLTTIATQMSTLGDTTPWGVRRAHALALLAHPQHTLNLFADQDADDEPAARQPQQRWRSTQTTVQTTLYLHLTRDDLHTAAHDDTGGDHTSGTGGCGTGAGWVEKLGAASLDLLRDWLQRSDRITIRPVLDPNRADAVDRHDPPDWMRETVILRDGHCVFPGCTLDARRCDLDHITAYRSPDHGGPPGQTNTANLACLCRRHHRLKTHTAWTYRRLPTTDGTTRYTWTSPHQHTYTTTSDPKH